MKKFELDTPALILDLDRFERNLTFMRDRAAAAGKKLRPHAKTHKCPEIARRQLAAGNCAGICAAKLSEAEKLQAGGVDRILITSPVVDPEKIGRLIRLNGICSELMATGDHPENFRALAAAAAKSGKRLKVLIDVNPDMGRTGTSFGEALELGRFVASFPSLELRGIQCYCGQLQHIPGFEERRADSRKQMLRAGALFREFRKAGLDVDILTGTGTGTAAIDLEIPEITDIQVGSYCFMDAEYGVIEENGKPLSDIYPPALSMLAGVVSVNQPNFVTVDAGTKALYLTPDAPPRVLLDGKIQSDWRYEWFGDEHGRLYFPDGRKPELNEKIELVVSHCDPTVNQFDSLFAVRRGEVAGEWEIALRGCCR